MNTAAVPPDELGGLCCDCDPSAEPNTRHIRYNSHRPYEERVWTLGARCLPMRTPCVAANLRWSEFEKSMHVEVAHEWLLQHLDYSQTLLQFIQHCDLPPEIIIPVLHR